MNDRDLHREVTSRGGLIAETNRAHFELTGSDRVRYLNGQVTGNVLKAAPDHATPACILTAKGKMCGEIFFSAGDGLLRIDCPLELREPLAARLERYIIADDAVLADVTTERALIHLYNTSAPASLPVQPIAVRTANRLGKTGTDLLVHPADVAPLVAFLQPLIPAINRAVAESLRVEAGIPAWGSELDENTIPLEANHLQHAIDFEKGCYVGQEVISRIRSIGSPSRTLRHLSPVDAAPLAPGAQLFDPAGPAGPVGTVTSVAFSFALDKPLALGYVKRGREAVGTRLSAGSTDPGLACVVEVIDSPPSP